MKPFFNTDQRVAKLLHVAGTWIGTPWCANSSAKGERGGVSCHNGPRAILIECAHLRQDFPVITGDPNHSRALNAKSLIEPFLDGRPEFKRIASTEWTLAMLQPGDLLGLKMMHCVDHLGVVLSVQKNGGFIHTLMHKRTGIDPISTPPWSQMIKAVWRPLE